MAAEAAASGVSAVLAGTVGVGGQGGAAGGGGQVGTAGGRGQVGTTGVGGQVGQGGEKSLLDSVGSDLIYLFDSPKVAEDIQRTFYESGVPSVKEFAAILESTSALI